MQNHHNHPVRLRLPPLQRRGIGWCRYETLGRTTPIAMRYQITQTTLDGAVEKVPSCIVGGNCLVQNHHNHPVRLRLPPLQRRGIDWCRYETLGRTTPIAMRYQITQTTLDGAVEKVPSCIVGGNCLVQNHHNHLVRLRLPPLQRRGIDWCRYETLGRTTPIAMRYQITQTTLDGAVEKVPSCIVGGNCLVQNHHNHLVRLRLPPLQRRGMY